MSQPATPYSRLCVSLARPTLAALSTAAKDAAHLADVLELRLDALTGAEAALSEAELRGVISSAPKPLLFTNRAAWEGGHYLGTEEQRIAPLLLALSAGCAFVDIEMRTPEKQRRRVIDTAQRLVAACNQGKTHCADHGDHPLAFNPSAPGRVIISWHDFESTPDTATLADIVRRQRESGADIGKLVTMAHDYRQVLRVLALQELAADLNFPLIAFCMGEAGMISRLATCALGGFMTYAAAEAGEATAPGQLPATAVRQIEALMVRAG